MLLLMYVVWCPSNAKRMLINVAEYEKSSLSYKKKVNLNVKNIICKLKRSVSSSLIVLDLNV